MENLLSVIWSASLLVGGLIFWLYFFQIQYFPDLSFDESVLLLLLAAFTGIFFLLLMAAMFMIPYLFRWMMLKAYDSDSDGKDRHNWGPGEISWYFFSIYLAIVALFIKFLGDDRYNEFVFTESSELSWIFSHSKPVFWVLIAIIFLFECVWCYLFDFKKKCISKRKFLDSILSLVIVIVFSSITALTSFFSLIILIPIEQQTEAFEGVNPIYILAVFFFWMMFTNAMYAYFQEYPEKRKSWVYLIPFLALLIIFFWAKDPIIPKLVMKKFHLGSFPADRLILDKEGCKLLRNLGLKPEPKDKNDYDLNECYLKDIKILSRLGKIFVLEKKIGSETFNFNIPKDHVLSWRIIKKEKANGESGKNKNSDSGQAKTHCKKKTEPCPKDKQAEAS
jgi:hypothetical protein